MGLYVITTEYVPYNEVESFALFRIREVLGSNPD
jgi:hypothetical protein